LSSNEDARLAGGHAMHGAFHVALLADDVAVEAHQRCVGKELGQGFFDALSALADGLDGEAADRTARRQGLIGAAVMTAQAPHCDAR